MMKLLIPAVLLALVIVFHREPEIFIKLKERYALILDALEKTNDPMWHPVLRPAIITGMKGWNKKQGPIGSNVNKGYEIYICLDGDDLNSATYVLMHELAHMSVREYDHTTHFWDHFKKLKEVCISAGLYVPLHGNQYCGDSLS